MTDNRPVVHVAVADAACRARIVDALHRQGWSVAEQRTGFHLLQALAEVIDGEQVPLPAMLVVDAISRGCAGVTIAAGLRELGVRIPLVLVARGGDPVPECDDPMVRVVGPSDAPAAIVDIAREVAIGPVRTSGHAESHRAGTDRSGRVDAAGTGGACQGQGARLASKRGG
jgi:sulfur carrier protein ThiS